MATGTIPAFTTGLYVRAASGTGTAFSITPSSGSGWFMFVCSQMRASTGAVAGLINWYGNTALMRMLTPDATPWSVSVENGVITVTRTNSYMPVTVISNIGFTLTST